MPVPAAHSRALEHQKQHGKCPGHLGLLQLTGSSRRFPRKLNRELDQDRGAGVLSGTAPQGLLCFALLKNRTI